MGNSDAALTPEGRVNSSASRDGLPSEMEEILSYRLSPGAQDGAQHGSTPLHLAASNGCRDVVAILLSRGADPNLPDGNGRTALHLAAEVGHCRVLQLLLDHGANVDARVSISLHQHPSE